MAYRNSGIVLLLALLCCAVPASLRAAESVATQANTGGAASPQSSVSTKPQPDTAINDSAIQGWTGTAPWSVAKPPPDRQAPATDQTDARSDRDEGNPNFQGYMPDWTPPESGESLRDTMPRMSGPMMSPAHRR